MGGGVHMICIPRFLPIVIIIWFMVASHGELLHTQTPPEELHHVPFDGHVCGHCNHIRVYSGLAV